MRILVLGGTVFLSHATAAEAVARGHDVTCAARGVGGPVPAGARHVPLDRERPDWSLLADRPWDAVVDVARYPSWARAAVRQLGASARSWVLVSTISVYSDTATPGQGVDAPLRSAPGPEVHERSPAIYAELKVACERAVGEHLGDRALVVRPGLVIGPGDPSGRFAYWPRRVAESATVLAPGEPEDPVQTIDVRDLARWLVLSVEQGVRGVYNAIGPVMTRAEMLEAVAAAVGRKPRLVWVPQEFLSAHDVRPWAGRRSLPLWLPLPEYAGHLRRDVSATLRAGLTVRPLAETATDTWEWLRQTPDAPVTGLTLAEHRDLLHRWHHVDLRLT